MRAEIISCGTELLLGHITDTNATYLAQSLPSLGIDLYFVSQVGDNQGRIVETLRRAWERSDMVILTGGLGPTEDDLARESISELVGETMQVDPDLEAELRAMFAARNSVMPERNIKQATLIPSAQALRNPRGTAPGWWVEKDGRIIVAMPGVPREMYYMWENEVLPKLASFTGGLIVTRILRVWGLGESAVEERLGSVIRSNNPTVATYAKSDGIDVRITAKAETKEKAEQQVAKIDLQIRQLLGHYIFGVDRDTLQSVIGKQLSARNKSLAVMDYMTGGLLSSTVTDDPLSSRLFKGAIVSSYPNINMQMDVPQATINQHGIISDETARAMAHVVRERWGADYGLGITGITGPEKQEDKPVGTVHIAIEGPEGMVTGKGPGWRASREDNKRLAVLAALNLLRLHLEGIKKGQ